VASTVTVLGAVAAFAGTAETAALGVPDPEPFTATIVNVYCVPFVRPVIVVDALVGDVPLQPPHAGEIDTT
jgi:hypothetical protein